MSQTLKRISSVLLLLVFLIPSAGILIYAHKCNQTGSLTLDMQTGACCNSDRSGSLSCCYHSYLEKTGKEILSASQCCDNSNIYLKLGSHIAGERLSIIHPYAAFIIAQFYNLYESDLDVMPIYTSHYLLSYPPGEDSFLLNSSLRL